MNHNNEDQQEGAKNGHEYPNLNGGNHLQNLKAEPLEDNYLRDFNNQQSAKSSPIKLEQYPEQIGGIED